MATPCRRGRIPRIVLWLAGAIVLLGVGGAFIARDPLRERWWLHRLDAGDAEVRSAVARRLGAVGGEQAARALVVGLASKEPFPPEAVGALEAIFPRLSPKSRRWAAAQLLAGLHRELAPEAPVSMDWGDRDVMVMEEKPDKRSDTTAAVTAFLAHAAVRHPELLPILAAELGAGDPSRLCTAVLAQVWPASQAALDEVLAKLPPAKVESALEGFLELARTGRAPVKLEGDDPLPPARLRGLLADLARRHPRPEVRAVALCKAFKAPGGPREPSAEDDLLATAHATDPERLVRRTALMLTSWSRPRTRLDAGAVLREESDPELLMAAIQTRLQQSTGMEPSSIELAPGLSARLSDSWNHVDASKSALGAGELVRLRAILTDAREPRPPGRGERGAGHGCGAILAVQRQACGRRLPRRRPARPRVGRLAREPGPVERRGGGLRRAAGLRAQERRDPG